MGKSYIGAVERAEVNIGTDNLDKLSCGLGIAVTVLLMDPQAARLEIYG